MNRLLSLFLFILLMNLSAHANDLTDNARLKLYYQDKGIPWGMDWLPDGDMLISFREGYLIKISPNGITQKISGLPEVSVDNQGGLLDVLVHPEYTQVPWVYFSYAYQNSMGNKGTAIARAQLKETRFYNWQVLYQSDSDSSSSVHFGSRLAIDQQRFLFFSIGDRGARDVNPQELSKDGGKIYRLHDDGRIPTNNPFVSRSGIKTAVWSYGHRNPQGLAIEPTTKRLWSHEHGPKGGDEVNLITKGSNYGWPLVTHGRNYWGTKITDHTTMTGMTDPLWYWVPSIAPSGMAFITSDKYPVWQGKLAIGSLKFGLISLLTIQDNKVTEEERAFEQLYRVRNIAQGPDGLLYVAVDGQGIYQVLPLSE